MSPKGGIVEIIKDDVFPEKPFTAAKKTKKAPVSLEAAITARAHEIYVLRGKEFSTPEEQLNDWRQAEREIREEYGLA